MDKRSISGIIGKGSIRHNNREFIAANVDPKRTKDNIVLCRQNIRDSYHDLFDEALEIYNESRTRKDRVIPDYYEHIRLSKQEKLFYEVIFQIGDMKDTAVGTPEGDLSAAILKEFYDRLQKNNPHIHIFNAVIHMDEATPHLHIDFIPVATECKRGLSTKNSLSKALEQQGFKSEGKFNTCTKLWIDSEKSRLAECMSIHGIEHEIKGIHRSNLSVEEYKLQERMKEVAELEEKISDKTKELSDIDSNIENKQDELEQLAGKETQIRSLDEIQVDMSRFSNKVKISREDYYSLMDSSKKYYSQKSNTNVLKAQIQLLESQNAALNTTISEQQEKISQLNSLVSTIKAEVRKLKHELSKITKQFDKVMNFIDSMGLKEKLVSFLNKLKKQNRDMER